MRSVIISISSDIGQALAHHFRAKKHKVIGTYRTHSPDLETLADQLIHCDLNDPRSLDSAVSQLKNPWDQLILAPGTLEPIGPFESLDFAAWRAGIETNLLAPLQIVHALLPFRKQGARVLFFAGAGTGGPAPCYSCYALSKIGLIKMCEQLASEIPDCTFSIIGPGWVRTKIHEETLQAKEMAGANYERTLEQLEHGNLVPMERVVECCEWVLNEEAAAVNGRNFSLVHDNWKNPGFRDILLSDPNLYKLRRSEAFVAPQ